LKFGIVVSLMIQMYNMQGFSDIRILKGYSNRDLEIHGRNWNFFLYINCFHWLQIIILLIVEISIIFFFVLICKSLLIYGRFETKSNQWLAVAHLGQIISLSHKELTGTQTPICPWTWCTLKLRYTQTKVHLGVYYVITI